MQNFGHTERTSRLSGCSRQAQPPSQIVNVSGSRAENVTSSPTYSCKAVGPSLQMTPSPNAALLLYHQVLNKRLACSCKSCEKLGDITLDRSACHEESLAHMVQWPSARHTSCIWDGLMCVTPPCLSAPQPKLPMPPTPPGGIRSRDKPGRLPLHSHCNTAA